MSSAELPPIRVFFSFLFLLPYQSTHPVVCWKEGSLSTHKRTIAGKKTTLTSISSARKKKKEIIHIREIANYFLAPTQLQPKRKDMTERESQPTPGRGAKIQSD